MSRGLRFLNMFRESGRALHPSRTYRPRNCLHWTLHWTSYQTLTALGTLICSESLGGISGFLIYLSYCNGPSVAANQNIQQATTIYVQPRILLGLCKKILAGRPKLFLKRHQCNLPTILNG